MNRQQWNGRKKPDRAGPRFRRGLALLLALSAVLLIYGAARLIGYYREKNAARRASEELRELYTAVGTALPDPPEETTPPTPLPTAAPEAPEATPVPTDSPAPEATPIPRLSETAYADNPGLTVSSRFRTLQKQNRDIVGWLTVGRMVDEPVVQRDNEYYMDHDVKGKANVNGAVFLDAAVSLKTRPYALILYGHNMKSGAMFGSLRNYESAGFYHNYPFITCDTIYEEGRFVIFAVGNVSTEESDPNYLDFFGLITRNIHERIRAIDTLKETSLHTCTVDVQPDDQLLVLVTCVGKDTDRRLVAARRIRDGETEKELKKTVEKSKKK